MRQQISAPAFGIEYKSPFSLPQQGSVKFISQPSFQNQVQPIVQQKYQYQQQSYPQQFNRQICPINRNSNATRGMWEQQGVQRIQSSHGDANLQSPLQVVDLQQVEEPWRLRVQELQNRIKELEAQKQNKIDNDDEDEEVKFNNQLTQQKFYKMKFNNYKRKQSRDKMLQMAMIGRYKKKDKEIEEANQYIQELHGQLEEQTTNVEEKHKYLFDEVNTWKKKFIEQNREFHQKQEELMILQAELDNLRNAQIIIGKSSDYKQQK
ncbi:unnamed protein product (macronuclear) [Paramecium tetraurelia]|uniref:BZIP domain-containing protein n=1 Tax=Paramecium tetraurelia TaxID=5888 RepID=A0CXJ9_PARTE|nr:uncharacterized protein GSPATT00011148001 [Paramecium tetraurelia]CAK75516.1 unnamed protein product [Paramecium tetraurelia]|eukprot:XP_001442913.1 hypothetical protein (macronuclear) [Paramecium tetraurelia strain d4-2]